MITPAEVVKGSDVKHIWEDNVYAITITLRPSTYKYTIEEQATMLSKEIERLQTEVLRFSVSFCFELTEKSNIHAHGFLRLNRPNKYSWKRQIDDLFRTSTIIGFICKKELTSDEVWFEYCRKAAKQMHIELGYHIGKDELNIFQDIWHYLK